MDKETNEVESCEDIEFAVADAEAREQIISEAQEDDLREREDDESREEEAKVGLDRTGDS